MLLNYTLKHLKCINVFSYDESKKEWILLFDLATFGIKKITRFNFDPKNNYLVIVDNL